MTTFKGFVRSTTATMGRIERASQQRARQAAKIEKLQLKEEMLANAAAAVTQYNELVDLLISVHKEATEPVEWQQVLDEPPPVAPVASNQQEQEAIDRHDHYTPSFFDKLLGAADKKRAALKQAIGAARDSDKSLFEAAQAGYAQQQQEWEEMQQLATGVLKKDAKAGLDAVSRFNTFADVVAFISSLTLTFYGDYVVADLLVRENDILPKQVRTLTSTGKLSKKDMGVSKFNELYQDHVCSCLLRIGRDILALLPVDFVIVNANGDLLNPTTGRVEQQAIVSAAIFPDTLGRLHFDSLDPSDSMKNFKHVMEFSKLTGFRPVQPLEGAAFSKHHGAGNAVRLTIDPTDPNSPIHSSGPSAFDQQIIDIYKQKGELHAVKFYKDHTKSSLSQSKAYVEQLAAAHGVKKGSSGGCAGVVVLLVVGVVGVVYWILYA